MSTATLSPQQIEALLSRMTLAEKAAQVMQIPANMFPETETENWARTGAGSFLHTLGPEAEKLQRIAVNESRLGIPLLFGIDAVRGHALKNGATLFPCPLAMACTWDPQALESAGRITAREVAADGLHWTFSPLLCVARDLRWGRVDETFGEAPALIGELAAAMIRGYQGDDLTAPDSILACAKHYLAYGESLGGRDSVDAPISLRLVRQLFLPPFAKAAQAGCATFMTAYSSVDGVPLTIHHTLLTDVLKKELGFDGFVVTDWDNVRSLVERQHVCPSLRSAAVQALAAGNDMFMATPDARDGLIAAMELGELDEAVLDGAVRRILTVKSKLGLFTHKKTVTLSPSALHQPDAAVNRRIQQEALVLLQNDGTLPLAAKRIAVVGPAADDANAMLGDWTYLSHPGPAFATPALIQTVTPLQGLQAFTETCGLHITTARGCGFLSQSDTVSHPYGDHPGIAAEIERLRGDLDVPALTAACKDADVIVACVGDCLLQNGEGRDRANLDLSGDQQAMLNALHAMGKPLVVVLVTGKPLTVPWVKANASAVVQVFNGGKTCGQALAELLLGTINPCGKLPIAFAGHVGQQPVYHNQLPGWHNGDYEDMPARPLYPFGFGLSYTAYRYGDAFLSQTDAGRTLTVPVTNAGARDGIEIVQVYAHRPAVGRMTPVKELLTFARVALAAGETKYVCLPIPQDGLLSVRDDGSRVLEKGEYTLMVGPSSQDEDLESLFFTVG